MCGRFYLDADLDEILRRFQVRQIGSVEIRQGEHFPTQQIPVIYDGLERTLVTMRWGWEAAFMKRPLINARAETLLDKGFYRQAARKCRCIVPISGYYEWAAEASGKHRYAICQPEEPLMALAALYQSQPDPSGALIEAVTIITRAAAPETSAIHDRMPLVLAPGQWEDYLSAALPDAALAALLKSSASGQHFTAIPKLEETHEKR